MRQPAVRRWSRDDVSTGPSEPRPRGLAPCEQMTYSRQMAARIDYEGSPAFVEILATYLRDEGLEVAHEPVRHDDVDDDDDDDDDDDGIAKFVLEVSAGRSVDVLLGSKIERAIERFWQRSPLARLKVSIHDADGG